MNKTIPIGSSSSKRDANVLGSFTAAQIRTAGLAAQGLATKTIADREGVTERSVKQRLHIVMERVGATTRVELARWWMVNAERYGDCHHCTLRRCMA